MKALSPEDAIRAIQTGATSRIEPPHGAPRYSLGDRVKARNLNPRSHTRLPRYVRGKIGSIVAIHGVYALPDTNAIGRGRNEQYCYSVRFESVELWGPEGSPGDSVYIDLWDYYLDPVPASSTFSQ